MKKLFVLAILFIGLNMNAQEKSTHPEQQKKLHSLIKDFSPEQLATLKSKRMTLSLDLSDAQEKQLYSLFVKEGAARREKMEARKKNKKENEKITSDERFNRMTEKLDKQIEMKRKISSILTKQQMEKFEQMKMKRKQPKKNGRDAKRRH